ncbi:MAG: SAM-dependent methyltransferase [Chloroflexota bacterium]
MEKDRSLSRWVPAEVRQDIPSAARIYDYLLGGYHNFECDRMAVEQLLERLPHMRQTAQVNRMFLRRAVNFLLDHGIDQFLDIGSGIPTAGNVHEIVHARNPEAVVVYVDIDPTAVAHSAVMLVDEPNAATIRADVRDVDAILKNKAVNQLIDFNRPAALMLVALLHYVTDDDEAYQTVDTYIDTLAPGSFMAMSHTATEAVPDSKENFGRGLRAVSSTRSRSREEISRFFRDLSVVEPGIVLTPLWRPEGPDDILLDEPEKGFTMAGIGMKPAK